jgi:chromosome segregation protein
MQRADEIVDHRSRSDGAAIHGVVADVVRAPELLEIAVEAALGDRLGGVLVSEPEVGLAAIGFLKQGGGGRSAFVPLGAAGSSRPLGSRSSDAAPAWAGVEASALVGAAPGMPEGIAGMPEGIAETPDVWAPDAPRPVFEGEGGAASWMSPAWESLGSPPGDAASAEPGTSGYGKIEVEDRTQLVAAHAAIGGEGVLGRMADLVAFADGYEAVGKRLLGATVVVDDLDRALLLHKQGVTDRLVTLDGDLVEDGGIVAGGSRDAQGAGVLAQKREIRDLEEIVGTLEHDLSEAMARLVTAKTELTQVTKALEGLRVQVHEGEVAIMGHEKDEARIRYDLERHRDRLGQLAGEQHELDDRLSVIGTDEDAIRDRRAHAETRIAELERAQLDHLSDVATHRDRLDELAQVLTEAKIRAAQLGEKRAAAEASALRLAAMDTDLAARAAKLTAEIDEAMRRTLALRQGCDQLAAELAVLREERDAQAIALEEGRRGYDARLTALTGVELAARELRGLADQLAREVGQLELRAGQIKMTRQVVEDQVGERYQLEVPAILFDYHLRPQITQIDEDRLTELRELIERMGSDINLTAIEEYAEVGQRFEFLSAQKTDLERAVDQLQRAIDKINKTSRKLFKDTFAAVNTTFKEVFPRLFRGGQAALSLSGGDDVDLLEAGVEIMAQPPGKKNTTVEQLSGGEKALTAVALVFSIFLIKPSPFCILDEVDAPLDEANVDRYNELVREMTDRSQFIVITHNKRTMEAADNLYGVTMQEPGVSKLVSVNLSKLGGHSGAVSAAG